MVKFTLPHNFLRFKIKAQTDVGVARREIDGFKDLPYFTPLTLAEAKLVITELGSNLVKYAGGGEIIFRFSGLSGFIEIMAYDQGPGIKNFTKSFEDGYSTGGSSGSGLGAIKRFSSKLIFASIPGDFTCFYAQLKNKDAPKKPLSHFDHHWINFAIPGQKTSGDWTGIEETKEETHFLLMDGLGHGSEAADSSTSVGNYFRRNFNLSPESLWEGMFQEANAKRGGVLGFGEIHHEKEELTFFGMGNVQAAIYQYGEKPKHLISKSGLFGKDQNLPKPQILPFPKGAILVLHSDGLSNVTSKDFPSELYGKESPVIAAYLMHKKIRNTDDASILIIKNDL